MNSDTFRVATSRFDNIMVMDDLECSALDTAQTVETIHPDWLGIVRRSVDEFAFALTPQLARMDGRLFGGTGLATAVAMFEATTGRAAVWATVQFVGSADVGERFNCRVEVLAAGHRTSQVRLDAFVGGRLVFTALGSTAQDRSDGLTAQLSTMPEVSSAEDSPPFDLGFELPPSDDVNQGPFATAEYRQAQGRSAERLVWARLRHAPIATASVGYLADFVPNAVLRAAGHKGGGTSLDNSIRFGPATPPDTEWVLLENDPYFVDHGFVHGAARVWSPAGVLLAVASQSAAARLFEG